MKIGIMGGTFDPVHKAHIEISKLAYEKLGLSKVLFIPNGIPPHKKESSISKEDKLFMINLAIKDYPYFEVDTFEIDKDDVSYLYITLKYLKNKYPQDELYFIAGSDNIYNIDNWKNPHLIFEYANVVFIKRPEYEIDLEIINKLKLKYNCKISFIDFQGIDISSTEIRADFEKCLPVKNDMPDEVYSYIVEKALYPPGVIKKLSGMLDEKRLVHSLNVAKEAYKLALFYNADCEKAYYAGLLHDCAKKLDTDLQKDLISKYNEFPLLEDEMSFPKVIHALSGAIVAKREFGITDKEILSAVRFHTLGSVNMSDLDKIIYIADLISEERNYKGVEILRQMAYNNMDKAILMSIENTIEYLKDGKIQPDVLKLRRKLNGCIN